MLCISRSEEGEGEMSRLPHFHYCQYCGERVFEYEFHNCHLLVTMALERIKNLRDALQGVTITSEVDTWISQLEQMERTLRRNWEATKE